MAEEETKEQEQSEEAGTKNHKGLLRIVLLLGVVAVAAGAGFGMAQIMGGPEEGLAAEMAKEATPGSKGRKGEYVYVDFKTVTVNLNTDNLSRYLRVTLALAIKDDDSAKDVQETIKKHVPELESRLRVYLAGKTLDDVRGKENQNRIIGEIYDMFNAYLWRDARPMIAHVLFKDFILQ